MISTKVLVLGLMIPLGHKKTTGMIYGKMKSYQWCYIC